VGTGVAPSVSTGLCCSVLQWFAVCRSVSQCVGSVFLCGAVRYRMLQSSTLWCSVLQCVAGRGSALQGVVVCCNVLQSVVVCGSALQGVSVCCSMLWCVAMCFSMLQCVAICCSVLQCVAGRIDLGFESLFETSQLAGVRD